jgi:hypothetical protein
MPQQVEGNSRMTNGQAQGSNLYSIDFDALRSVLAEANAHLAKKQELLLAEIGQTRLADLSQDKSVRLAKKLKALIKDLRDARLTDGAPFRRASDLIKAYFSELDKPLSKALESLQGHLSRSLDFGVRAGAGKTVAIAVNRDGEPIIAATPGNGTHVLLEIPSKWEVKSVDRQNLDLESLRGLFTERELLLACKRHLCRHGPHQINGVGYARAAVIA